MKILKRLLYGLFFIALLAIGAGVWILYGVTLCISL